jgi:iron complex outermembrane recepter protein
MAICNSRVQARGAITFALLTATPLALAQNTPERARGATELAEVVVTATRRETKIQETPLAITAVGGDSIRDNGIVDPRQLTSLAPNLYVDQGLSSGQTHVSIRGIASTDFGIGSNSPVAINIDDVYQPYQFGLATQTYDMARIEVLRGPQGTLLGKNTTSGALSYYSKTPTHDKEGYAQVDGGSGDFGNYAFEGAYNQPLSDSVAMRLSARIAHRDNYVDNLFDGTKQGHSSNYNARLQFAWTPDEATTANLKLYYSKSNGDGPIYISHYLQDPCARLQQFGFSFPAGYACVDFVNASPDSPSPRKTNAEVPTLENFHSYGATLKFDHQIGGSTLTSITNYQKGLAQFANNDDGIAGDAFHSFQGSDTKQFSQELRLATPASAPLRAVFGVFGQYDKINTDQGSSSTQIDTADLFLGYDYYAGGLGIQSDTSLAAFSSVTYDTTDRLSFVAGGRYSYEKKKVHVDFLAQNFTDLQVDDVRYNRVLSRYPIDPLFDQTLSYDEQKSWKRFTWDVGANYKPSSDSLIFARVASGFRSGAYQIGITAVSSYTNALPDVSVDPEKVMNYELGFKSEWAGRTVRLNGSVFWTGYKDMQVQIVSTSGIGAILSNAAKSRIKGAELEVEYLAAAGVHFSGSLGYTDAKFLEYNTIDPNRRTDPATGFAIVGRLPYSPEWTANLSGSYEIPVNGNRSVILATDWTYRSQIFFDAFQEPAASDRGRTLGNARVSYGTVGKGWRATAYVRNLTNQTVPAFAFPFGGNNEPNSFLIAPTIYAPKLTWGLQASYDF